jgi:hypothetical protein
VLAYLPLYRRAATNTIRSVLTPPPSKTRFQKRRDPLVVRGDTALGSPNETIAEPCKPTGEPAAACLVVQRDVALEAPFARVEAISTRLSPHMKRYSTIRGVVAGFLRDRCACASAGKVEDMCRFAQREWPAMPASQAYIRRTLPAYPWPQWRIGAPQGCFDGSRAGCCRGRQCRRCERHRAITCSVVRSPTSILRLASAARRSARVCEPFARRWEERCREALCRSK